VLFVADADRIQALDIRAGSTWRLATPDSVNVAWIDGLAFAGGALIAHHPLSFWRIARYSLEPGWRRIDGRQLLEANTPDGRTSTTGEVVGDDYVYIGNSQIDRMNAKTIDAATMEPIRIYRVRRLTNQASSGQTGFSAPTAGWGSLQDPEVERNVHSGMLVDQHPPRCRHP
jgi:hypothetical protein